MDLPHGVALGPAGKVVLRAISRLNPHPKTRQPSKRTATVTDAEIKPIGRIYTPETFRSEIEAKVQRVYPDARVVIKSAPSSSNSLQPFQFTIIVTV